MFTLDLIVQTPKALPPLLWGTFGVAKSATMTRFAESMGAYLEVVIASIRTPEDFGGIKIPSEHGVECLPDAWVYRVKEALKADPSRMAYVVFDEISCTPPATQAALLRVMLEGVVGDEKLDPERVKFIAAANPPDEAAGGWDMARPLENRFTHVSWAPPNVSEFTDYLAGGPGVLPQFTKLDREKWEAAFPKASAHVGAFLRRFPEYMVEDVKKDKARFPGAWGRPRTWENVARLLATVYATGRRDAMFELVKGSVGEKAAIAFGTWLEQADLPDPEELLRNPSSWSPDGRREDVIYATLLGVAGIVVQPMKSAEAYRDRWYDGWGVIARAVPVSRGLCAVAARKICDERYRPKLGLLKAPPAVVQTINALKELLNSTGLWADEKKE